MTDVKSVAERIVKVNGRDVITLNKREKEIYVAHHSIGRRLIYFSDCQLRGFFDPNSDTMESALEELQKWLDWTMPTGEVWIAECADIQLLDPRRIASDNPAAMVAAEALVREYYS